ncbi:fosfomycin resistance glutathione transferase [Vibrio owensii]|uniref:fosfomycin resistance glutathione transferase n=1 Tax=Vibrio owensii TaxID=696485 RepID=UPI003AAFA17A
MLTGLNHITIAVSDLERSLDFYINALGFKGHVKWRQGAYLSLGDLWLCLSVDKPDEKSDYSHIAFSISQQDFTDFSHKLIQLDIAQWKENKSEGESLYLLDPDGHKLEIHSGDLYSRLESIKHQPYEGLEWL